MHIPRASQGLKTFLNGPSPLKCRIVFYFVLFYFNGFTISSSKLPTPTGLPCPWQWHCHLLCPQAEGLTHPQWGPHPASTGGLKSRGSEVTRLNLQTWGPFPGVHVQTLLSSFFSCVRFRNLSHIGVPIHKIDILYIYTHPHSLSLSLYIYISINIYVI